MPAATRKSDTRDWPLYWFARLEQAVKDGDHEAAAEAQRELATLGVRVQYGRPHADTLDRGAPRKEAGHG
jgi:hypothetical protein